jgi:hypothetical protein
MSLLEITEPILSTGDWHVDRAHSVGGLTVKGDLALVWNRALEAGGVLVGDAVGLELDISAVRVAR